MHLTKLLAAMVVLAAYLPQHAALASRNINRHQLCEDLSQTGRGYDRRIAACTYLYMHGHLSTKYRSNVLGNRCGLYNYEGKFDLALADCNKAIELNPRNAVNYNNRGNAYLGKKLYDLAIADYNSSLALNPRYAFAYHNRGLARLDKGEFDKAIDDLNSAIALDPHYALAYANRGIVWEHKGDDAKAMADMNKAVELAPKNSVMRRVRGVNEFLTRHYDAALDDLTQAVKLGSREGVTYIYLGRVYLYTKKEPAQALAALDKAVKYAPQNSDSFWFRGHAYYNLGKYAEAADDYAKVTQIVPKFNRAYNECAWAYFKAGKASDGLGYALKAVAREPDNAEALDTLGHIDEVLGNKDAAITYYKKALAVDPTLTGSQEGLKRLNAQKIVPQKVQTLKE